TRSSVESAGYLLAHRTMPGSGVAATSGCLVKRISSGCGVLHSSRVIHKCFISSRGVRPTGRVREKCIESRGRVVEAVCVVSASTTDVVMIFNGFFMCISLFFFSGISGAKFSKIFQQTRWQRVARFGSELAHVLKIRSRILPYRAHFWEYAELRTNSLAQFHI